MLLVVASGAHTPLTWAGVSPFTPAMTSVLPAQQVSLPPADGLGEPPGDPLPLDDTAAVPPTPAPVDSAPADPQQGSSGGDDKQDDDAQPAIRHVFVVMLSQTDLAALADDAATPPAAPYFATRLLPQGTLLTDYDAVARGSLANGVALLSGQGPTAQTLTDCPTETGAAPADVTPDVLGDDGQQIGDGCVYPFATGTMPDQLTGAALDWRAYIEDAPGPCPATPRNPFAYFHSLLDAGMCTRHVAGFDRLDADLARGADAPALFYLAPNACHDGQATPCTPGAPAGPAAADAFLRDLIPQLLASPAYADGGLIAITSDGPPPPPAPAPTAPAPPTPTTPVEPPPTITTPTTPTIPTPPPGQTTPTTTTAAPQAAIAADDSAGPVPTTYPNVGDAATAGAARVGALLISPAAQAGRRSTFPANHFTLLRAISDVFALQPLGYAGIADLKPLPEQLLRTNAQ
jgi:hypothetical protein